MTKQKYYVLITSVSAKISLITCVRDSLSQNELEVQIIGADSNPHAIARHFTDDFWHMPYLSELSVGKLIDYCKMQQIDMIIPTREGELQFFATHKNILEQNGIFVMVSNELALITVQDKLHFYQFLREKDYNGIITSLSVEEIDSDRFVVKERFGAGSANLILNVTKDEASELAQNLKHPIYQPYIEGTEYSIDVYVDRKGKSKGAIARERVLVVDGESQITKTIKHEKLEKMAMSLAEALNLQGHVMFQVIIDHSGNYYIVECNPRFGGASTLSIRAGLDSFYWFLLEAQGKDISKLPFNRTKRELTQVRYKKDLIL